MRRTFFKLFRDGLIYSGSENLTYHRRGNAASPLANSPLAAISSQFGSYHPGVCQFVFADGRVRPLNNNINPSTLECLAKLRDGGVNTGF